MTRQSPRCACGRFAAPHAATCPHCHTAATALRGAVPQSVAVPVEPLATTTQTQTRVTAARTTVAAPAVGLNPNRPYHRRFARFKPAVLTATRELFSQRVGSQSLPQVLPRFQAWADAVMAAYDLPPVLIRATPPGALQFAGGGQYDGLADTITMDRPSLITLIHEVRHALQFRGAVPGVTGMSHTAAEDDARAWSLSLYHRLQPDRLQRLVAAGRVHHITVDDFADAPATPGADN